MLEIWTVCPACSGPGVQLGPSGGAIMRVADQIEPKFDMIRRQSFASPDLNVDPHR